MSIFNSVLVKKPRRSVFNLSHDSLLSVNPGYITPVLVEEVLPGDRFRIGVEHVLRCMPLKSPILSDIKISFYFFYVPNRIVWSDFDDFLAGEVEVKTPLIKMRDVLDSLTTSGLQNFPVIFSNFLGLNSLADYLGIPSSDILLDFDKWTNKLKCDPNFSLSFSALPFRAYQLIYNEYFRNQYLSSEVDFSKSSEDIVDYNSALALMRLQKCCYSNDYFTSALPFLQKGEQLSINSITPQIKKVKNSGKLVFADGGRPSGGNLMITPEGRFNAVKQGSGPATQSMFYDPEDSLALDYGPSSQNSVTVSDLRRAFSIQRFLEKQARIGSRFKEVILANFGVNVKDYRIDRPEFLGGYKSPVLSSEILQTSATQTDSPLGTMAGRAISVGGLQKTHFFPEHGFLIGVCCLKPTSIYAGGMPRAFTRTSRFDYYWPDFQHIGEQAVRNGELFYDIRGGSLNSRVFGYQSRYSEYKHHPSKVHGDFLRSLSYWHTARMFDKAPTLNDSFVSSDISKRIMAYQGTDFSNFLLRLHFDIKAQRPISYFSDPI